MGSSLAALFLAEGWAVPIPFDEPPPATDAFEESADLFGAVEERDPSNPPNLIRERYPSYLSSDPSFAAHFIRRRRRR